MRLKFKMPSLGLYFYVAALAILIAAYVIAIQTFNAFSLAVDRFVLIFPIFAMYIIVLQIVMSYLDDDKPIWFGAIDLLFCFFVLFSFGKLLSPFLTIIGIYFTVNMGDISTYAIVVPKCITGCILFAVSGIVFVTGSFFNIFKKNKEEK